MRKIEDPAFIVLVGIATLAFAFVLQPFFGPILWSVVIAIVFASLHVRLLKAVKGRRNLAAILAVFLVTIIAIVPLLIVGVSLSQQASSLYYSIQSGQLDVMAVLERIIGSLPPGMRQVLAYFGVGDAASAKELVVNALSEGRERLAAGAFGVGLGAFDFVLGLGIMLYLLFFLFRDGEALENLLRNVVPLRARQKAVLFRRFSLVIRGTVNGGISVAAVQGALGGLAFWFLGIPAALLWAVVMALLSLLPAIGAALVWGPVALYLLVTGSVWEGLFLIAYGVVIIGLTDNLLRPYLVGRSTKLPDYIVLISTLGGIELFGLNGFVVGPLIAAMFMVSWDIYRKKDVARASS